MSRTALRIAVILAASLGLGAVCNVVSPRRIAWITPPREVVQEDEYLPLEQAHAWWSTGEGVFLDARSPEDYQAGHIASALNLPVMTFNEHFGRVAPLLHPSSKIVVYCDGTECELSHRLQQQLAQMSFTNTHILFNGWTVWKDAGHPVEQGPMP